MSRKYLSFRALILCAGLIACLSGVALAQFQRMAIPSGSYSIPPQGTSRLTAYCMDYTRKAPRPGMSYGHVLRGGSATRIQLGDKVMSIEEGVERGLIVLEGNAITVDDLIDSMRDPVVRGRLPEEIRAEAQTIIQLWDAASEEERSQVRTMLEPMIREQVEGDYTSLSIRNLTNRPVTLEVGEPLVVGAAQEPTSDLPKELIPDSDAPQAEYWRARNILHQRELQELGYYLGPIDGDFGPKSNAALRSFQEAFHVDEDGSIGPRTRAALDAALARTRALRRANEGAGRDALVFRLERFPETDPDMLFVLYDDSGRPTGRTNDVGELLQILRDNPRTHAARSVYLDAPGFTAAELAGLRTSLSIREHPATTDLRVRPLRRAVVSEASPIPLFDRGVELVRISEITQATDRPGFEKAELVIDGPQGQGRFRVFARARAVLHRFREWVSRTFSKSRRVERSPSELIHDAIRSIRQQHPELQDEDLQIEFEDQFGVIQIVGNLHRLHFCRNADLG